MESGVGKSGSPAPKPTTGRPAAFSAFAFASTASVADSAIPPTRAEIRRPAAEALEGGALMPPMLALRRRPAHPGPLLGSTARPTAGPTAGPTARFDLAFLRPVHSILGGSHPGRSCPQAPTRVVGACPRREGKARGAAPRTTHRRALAQLAEHRSPKPKVGGSSPSCPAEPGAPAGPSAGPDPQQPGRKRRNRDAEPPRGLVEEQADQSDHLLQAGRGRAPEGRLADAAAADHLLRGGAGVRARGDDHRLAARPGLRPAGLQGLRLAREPGRPPARVGPQQRPRPRSDAPT